MYTPIHAGPERASLIGFFAINVHWIEIGGIQTASTDIFMEGLQLRSIKLWSKGEPIEEVYRIIENNTRMPAELMGDIAAQLAGCLLGRDLTAELADKYGVATFQHAVGLILDQSEAGGANECRCRHSQDGMKLPAQIPRLAAWAAASCGAPGCGKNKLHHPGIDIGAVSAPG
jgi:N-methylhydantoinase B/oxoprolinase/acetone carboxylase alpha subunit